MFDRRSFTVEEILNALKELNIEYDLFDTYLDKKLHFCSLKSPESNGIYYAEVSLGSEINISESLIIVSEKIGYKNCAELVVNNPQLTFYKLMDFFFNEPVASAGIHPTAIVDKRAVIHPSAYIGPYCVLDECVIEAGVKLHSHVVVMKGTHLSKNVTVESHSTIGATGVAWIWDSETSLRIRQPQIGYTFVGEGTFLGSDISIVRGSVNETTSIGSNCVIAHGSKIGHGSVVGSQCHFANNISLAGNVTLGERCFLGAGAIVRPNTKLANGIVVAAGAVVVNNYTSPDLLLIGMPAKPAPVRKKTMSGVPKPLND